MKVDILNGTKAAAFGWFFVLLLSLSTQAQTKRPVRPKPMPVKAVVAGPKVMQVDEVAFRKLLTPNGKPLLINFWATWCDPCREEFPDLVKLDQEFKGRIDFITISLDDPEDIATTVPKFLASMRSEMPAYLLKAADEGAVISSISSDWNGGMPFTALYNAKGELVYFREGKVVIGILKDEVQKLLPTSVPAINN